MKKLFKIVAVLLTALWLPATLHCDLEAAEIHLLETQDHESSVCQQHCVQDACPTVEGVSYTKNAVMLRVLPPPASVLFSLLDLVPVLQEVTSPEATFVTAPPAVAVLDRTWSFTRRTALPVRAPAYAA